MRKRLMGCLAGGVVGFCIGPLLSGMLGLSPLVTLGASTSGGIAIGYVATTLADVFMGA